MHYYQYYYIFCDNGWSEYTVVLCVFRQGEWASVFLKVLLGHRWLISPLIHRLWDLLHKQVLSIICFILVNLLFLFTNLFVFCLNVVCLQAISLSPAHVLGLAALFVELHHCRHLYPRVQVMDSTLSLSEHLSDALHCSTRSHMAFCLRFESTNILTCSVSLHYVCVSQFSFFRFCVAVLSYGLCKANSLSKELQNFIPARLYKKVQHGFVPRHPFHRLMFTFFMF